MNTTGLRFEDGPEEIRRKIIEKRSRMPITAIVTITVFYESLILIDAAICRLRFR